MLSTRWTWPLLHPYPVDAATAIVIIGWEHNNLAWKTILICNFDPFACNKTKVTIKLKRKIKKWSFFKDSTRKLSPLENQIETEKLKLKNNLRSNPQVHNAWHYTPSLNFMELVILCLACYVLCRTAWLMFWCLIQNKKMNYDEDVTLHVNGQNWLINKEKLKFTYVLVVLWCCMKHTKDF